MAKIPPEPVSVRRRSKPALGFALIALLACGALVVDFFRFAATLDRPVGFAGRAADAIVVLTGATGRIEVGLELLRSGKGERLLISGVHPSTTSGQLMRSTHAARKLFDCCVDLGRTARNTFGNAREAAVWVRKNGYRSLILVTSAFHMPRALVEFADVMPDLELVPHPIGNPSEKWWTSVRTATLLASEYSKLLLARVRTGLFSGR